jgi:hypothetical protein
MSTTFCDDERDEQPQLIGEILEELLAQYQTKFPGIRITMVETAA